MPTNATSKVCLVSTSAKATKPPRAPETVTESPTAPPPEASESAEPTMKEFDSSWLDMYDLDALNFRVEQLRALANAMYCVACIDEDSSVRQYLGHRRYRNEPNAVETLAPLSLLSQRLCDEVDYYVHKLNHRLREKGE